jgi:putative chitinase
MTPEQLKAVMPRCDAALWAPLLTAACDEFGIDTPKRIAAFLAQAAHESAELTALTENLNYSAQGLLATFPKRFTPETAAEYARNRERIANRVYANRYGNGDEASGEGWRFRGRGPFQLTFADNYRAFGDAISEEIVLYPDLVAQPKFAARSAAWFWKRNGMNALADRQEFDDISRKIHGDYRHFSLNDRQRYVYFEIAAAAFGLTSADSVG